MIPILGMQCPVLYRTLDGVFDPRHHGCLLVGRLALLQASIYIPFQAVGRLRRVFLGSLLRLRLWSFVANSRVGNRSGIRSIGRSERRACGLAVMVVVVLWRPRLWRGSLRGRLRTLLLLLSQERLRRRRQAEGGSRLLGILVEPMCGMLRQSLIILKPLEERFGVGLVLWSAALDRHLLLSYQSCKFVVIVRVRSNQISGIGRLMWLLWHRRLLVRRNTGGSIVRRPGVVVVLRRRLASRSWRRYPRTTVPRLSRLLRRKRGTSTAALIHRILSVHAGKGNARATQTTTTNGGGKQGNSSMYETSASSKLAAH